MSQTLNAEPDSKRRNTKCKIPPQILSGYNGPLVKTTLEEIIVNTF